MENDDRGFDGATPAGSSAEDSAAPGVAQENVAAPGELFSSAAAPVPAPPPDPYAHLPEDLRAPWSWLDLLISFFFGIGCLLVAAQFLGVILGIWGVVQPVEGQAQAARTAVVMVLHTIVTFGLLILYLLLVIRWRYRKPFWRTIGFRAFQVGDLSPGWSGVILFFTGMVLSLFVATLSQFVRLESPIPMQRLFEAPSSAVAFLAAAVLVAPFVEEILFRGWLYPVVARTFGVAGAIVIVGVLFGLMHGAQLGGHWQLVALLSFVGIMLTWVRARTGSVLSSYFLHLGYNGLIAFAFIAQTSGLRNLPAGGP